MWCRILWYIIILTLSLLAAPLATEAQPAGKVHRIGFLSPGFPRPDRDPPVDAFRQGLRDLGYVEGQNLVIEYRGSEGQDARLPALAAELARLQVEVIVAVGTTATRPAQQATHTIPIVMTGTNDPVGQGLVASLARPGGNITGLSLMMAELPGKRLELLKETVPQSTRVAVLANPAAPSYTRWMSNLTVAARALGLHLHVVEVRRADELDTAFVTMTRAGADALFASPDAGLLLDGLRGRIADLAIKNRLPTIYAWREGVDTGGLLSYGPSLPDAWRRAATYVDKILKGAKPADLPVEQPMKFKLAINLKTAKALGLTIPPSILFQADEVLQ